MFYINYYDCVVPKGYNVVDYIQERPQTFLTYDKEEFYQIIDEIKNTNIPFNLIAIKHGIDASTVYYLNRGDYHTIEGESYPLRVVQFLRRYIIIVQTVVKKLAKGQKDVQNASINYRDQRLIQQERN